MEETMKLVQKAARALRCELRGMAGEAGMTQAQWSVLNEIRCGAGKPDNNAVCIASRLGMDKPTMSGILKRLEKNGLISVKRDAADARSKVLGLTQKAYGLMDGAGCCGREAAAKAFRGFSLAESERLKIYMNRIIKNMEER